MPSPRAIRCQPPPGPAYSPAMQLTARDLNRATLARQMLLQRERLTPAHAVRRIVAMQAQEPASPYVGLWNRLEVFDPGAVDAAFNRGDIVKATLMRITLHAVHTEDYTTFHQAMVANLRCLTAQRSPVHLDGSDQGHRRRCRAAIGGVHRAASDGP